MSLELGQTTDRGERFPVTNGTAAQDMTDMDGPLIGDTAGLRASWQRIQAEFVDDPREAVVDAAALVEHVTQTLVGTLRQRQRQLRGMWDGTAAQATFTPNEAGAAEPARRGPEATFTPKETPGPGETPGPDGAFTSDGMGTPDDVRAADSGRVPASDDLRGNGVQGGAFQDHGNFQDPGNVQNGGAPAGAGVPASAGRAAAGRVLDTEQLRIVMRRYRSLLDQLCPPR